VTDDKSGGLWYIDRAGDPPGHSLMNMFRRSLSSLLVLALFAGTSAAAGPPNRVQARVVSVFDGDTIVVSLGSREATVRLIGVDTPETARPETPVQFHGPEASEFTRSSLLDRDIVLEFEPPGRQGGDLDKYGRTLAYVITADGRNFNKELVRLGHGRVYSRYAFTYQREFEQAERSARAEGLGIWNAKKRAAWSDPAQRGKIVGNIRSHIYHLPGQDGYAMVHEKNRIYFSSEEEAVKAGFRKARK
jgi:micrococcal nuclease